MPDLVNREQVYIKVCKGCTRQGEEPGICLSNEPCESLAVEFASAPEVDAVEVVRCRACVHAVEIEKDYVRKLFVDGTKQCELGRADTVFGYSIISNDGFCDSGERKDHGNQTNI